MPILLNPGESKTQISTTQLLSKSRA